MDYVSVKNLEKYHPKFKDRKLVWCKLYFATLNSDADFMLINETDKWRFFAFVMLELQTGKPTPLNEKFLMMKGFDFKYRSMSLTLKELQEFIIIDTNSISEGYQNRPLDKDKEKEKDIRTGSVSGDSFFEEFYAKYPKKVARGAAEKAWWKLNPNSELFEQIIGGVERAKTSKDWAKDEGKYIPHPATWLNQKRWLDQYEPEKKGYDIWQPKPVQTPS